ncbi:MAG: methyltransferase domain-containing protein [Litorimonas sp.]
MRETVTRLEEFYASPLGRAAKDMAERRLKSLWPDLSGKNVLGFGYSWPYLQPYQLSANRVVMAMPESQGALAHENTRGVATCLVMEQSLPFSDASFDNVLCVHGAEEAENFPALLRELWRVTRPEGRIAIIAANRAGLWARSEAVPFGAGRPFSRTQLRGALTAAGFAPIVWSGALYVPPIKRLATPKFIHAIERFGETVWPSFSGLVLVEALKRLYIDPSDKPSGFVQRPSFSARPIANRTVDSYEVGDE